MGLYDLLTNPLDVVTYVMTLPTVNPREVLLWGMSMGGAISGVAAAMDPRVAGLVMVCPLFSYVRADKRKSLFASLMKDRESQVRGNDGAILPMFNTEGENPAGFAGSGGVGGTEAARIIATAMRHKHPNYRDHITLQSYHKMALFRPKELLEDLLIDTPTLMVVPELDALSSPEEQKEVFTSLKCPKQLYWARQERHMTVLSDKDSPNIRKAMIDFFEAARVSRRARENL